MTEWPPTKVCAKCKESKPRTEFHKCASAKDGLLCYCMDCRNRNPSLTRQILNEIGEDPITSKEIATKLGIDSRACRSRMSLLQKRGDIVCIGYVDGSTKANCVKQYVRRGSINSMPLDTRLCHASNAWLKLA